MAERNLVVKIIGDSSSLQRSFSTATRSTKQFSNEVSRAERGALAGSGIFKSLGRSLAFASGGFLAFGGAAAFIRKSVDAANEARVANAQLATQLKNNGESLAQYRGQIDRTVDRLSALAGINNDELKQGLTTILRTTPNVSKALRDLGTAADLARARHISLAQAAIIIAKTEAGNTTLLRRQGFQIAKNATAEQALAFVRQKIAGQGRAGTTEQERFGAVLHNTEEIIGTALLPTINKYLASLSVWLEKMNESGKLQKDVSTIAKDFAAVMSGLGEAIKTVDRITGSFKNTLVLLLGLKFAGTLGRNLGTLTTKLTASRGAAVGLAGSLGNAGLAAQAGVAAFAITTLTLQATGLDKALSKAGGSVQTFLTHIPGFNKAAGPLGLGDSTFKSSATAGDKPGQIGGVNVQNVRKAAIEMLAAGKSADQTLQGLEKRFMSLSEDDLRVLLRIAEKTQDSFRAAGGAASEAGAKAAHGLNLAAEAANNVSSALGKAGDAKGGINLTAGQRNTFFDNAIARILLRGGLGDIQKQIDALEKADRKISQRIAVTKDITRKQKLEDELLQNQAQIRDLKAQQASNAQKAASDARQAAADARQALVDRRAKVLAARSARQFRELGLTSTGDVPTPGVKNLQKRISQITGNIAGTKLDTPKLEAQLKRFRKVLSEGLVPKDVRAKIKELLDSISDEIKNKTKDATADLTKFKHASSVALTSGLGLSPDQRRALEQRLAQVGQGGSVPGRRTQAFAGAGTTVVHTTVNLDGKTVAKNTTKHQRATNQNRSGSRRGPYAGRH
jgi:hypothetical protein